MTVRKGEFDGPKEDDLHFADGSHRTQPPAGANALTWERRRRVHEEGHRLDAMVRNVAPELFDPRPPTV
jgi:hypothetical protein